MTRRDTIKLLKALPLNERITFLRQQRKNERGRSLSHAAYGKLVGASARRLIEWEAGRSGISAEKAEALARLENLPVELFRPSAGEPSPPAFARLERRVAALERVVEELEADLRALLDARPNASSATP